jgi:hypothetical protein
VGNGILLLLVRHDPAIQTKERSCYPNERAQNAMVGLCRQDKVLSPTQPVAGKPRRYHKHTVLRVQCEEEPDVFFSFVSKHFGFKTYFLNRHDTTTRAIDSLIFSFPNNQIPSFPRMKR